MNADFRQEVRAMADILSLAMLVSVSAGALAFGVLAAYGVLRFCFALMRPQQRPVVVKPQPEAAQ
jgi:hypothetical protein